MEQKNEPGPNIGRREALKLIGAGFVAAVLGGRVGNVDAQERHPLSSTPELTGEKLQAFLDQPYAVFKAKYPGESDTKIVYERIPDSLMENIKKLSPEYASFLKESVCSGEVLIHNSVDVPSEVEEEMVNNQLMLLQEAEWPLPVVIPELVLKKDGSGVRVVKHLITEDKNTLKLKDILPLSLTRFDNKIFSRGKDADRYFLNNKVLVENSDLNHKTVSVDGFEVLYTEEGKLPQSYFSLNNVLGGAMTEWILRGKTQDVRVSPSDSPNILTDLLERMLNDGGFTYSEVVRAAMKGNFDKLVRDPLNSYLKQVQGRSSDKLAPEEVGIAFINLNALVESYILSAPLMETEESDNTDNLLNVNYHMAPGRVIVDREKNIREIKAKKVITDDGEVKDRARVYVEFMRYFASDEFVPNLQGGSSWGFNQHSGNI